MTPWPEERELYGKRARNLMKTDVHETENSYEMNVELPGFKKEDIKIDIENDCLTISAERHSEHENEEKKGSYVCCERTYGKYQRSFDVSGIDVDGIKAKYADGVLAVTLPKLVEVKPAAKAIAIE